MGSRSGARYGLVAGVLVGLALQGAAGAGTPRPPSLQITKATVDRVARTVDLRGRICFSAGPRALISVEERRTVHGVVKASRHWIPSAIKPTRIYPYACTNRWRLNWLLQSGLNGPGTYTVSIRLRDAYGRWTPPVSVSVTST